MAHRGLSDIISIIFPTRVLAAEFRAQAPVSWSCGETIHSKDWCVQRSASSCFEHLVHLRRQAVRSFAWACLFFLSPSGPLGWGGILHLGEGRPWPSCQAMFFWFASLAAKARQRRDRRSTTQAEVLMAPNRGVIGITVYFVWSYLAETSTSGAQNRQQTQGVDTGLDRRLWGCPCETTSMESIAPKIVRILFKACHTSPSNGGNPREAHHQAYAKPFRLCGDASTCSMNSWTEIPTRSEGLCGD